MRTQAEVGVVERRADVAVEALHALITLVGGRVVLTRVTHGHTSRHVVRTTVSVTVTLALCTQYWLTLSFAEIKVSYFKANSHRHARHDKTVLAVSRPLRRCESDSLQLNTVADKKF